MSRPCAARGCNSRCAEGALNALLFSTNDQPLCTAVAACAVCVRGWNDPGRRTPHNETHSSRFVWICAHADSHTGVKVNNHKLEKRQW